MKNPEHSPSAKTKKDLQEWYKNSDYQDIKFFIAPNVIISQEAAEAEVWAAIQGFEKDLAANPKKQN